MKTDTYSLRIVGDAPGSIICQCEHEGDARRIARMWAIQYKRQMALTTPTGDVIRYDETGEASS